MANSSSGEVSNTWSFGQSPGISTGFQSPADQGAVRATPDSSASVPIRGAERPRRRGSVSDRLSSFANVGGVNSLSNFARSWQRAAIFAEINPRRRSFQVSEDDEVAVNDGYARTDIDSPGLRGRSLLKSALERESRKASNHPIIDDDIIEEEGPLLSPDDVAERGPSVRRSRVDNIYQLDPQLASPFGGMYGSSYGSITSRVNESSMHNAAKIYRQQQAEQAAAAKQETEPLLVKRIQPEEGKEITVVVGRSTLPQTVFNSVNVLVGVGLLSLPLAVEYSGWLIGMVFFFISAVTTSYTAKLLAKCLDVDGSLITFADLAYVSFGPQARLITGIIFTVELLGACVALVVLFADSLNALIPGVSVTEFKIIAGILVLPLAFVPLRFLSFTSILGILCCMGIIAAVFVDGLVKPHAPGSLREPAATYLFPADWRTLPLSFGLLMAPWGGHSVFPNIYRDMRHPVKYAKAVNITYVFTYLSEVYIAIIGYLMFGSEVRDEITANIFLTKGYPRWISISILVAIAIIPITKVPLNARPIISTAEVLCGVDSHTFGSGGSLFSRGLIKSAIRVCTNIAIVIIAILIPSFDRIMSLLGSFACLTICVILPASFHLKIFGEDLSRRQKTLDWTLIVVASILAVLGTVCSCLPKSMLGAEKKT